MLVTNKHTDRQTHRQTGHIGTFMIDLGSSAAVCESVLSQKLSLRAFVTHLTKGNYCVLQYCR